MMQTWGNASLYLFVFSTKNILFCSNILRYFRLVRVYLSISFSAIKVMLSNLITKVENLLRQSIIDLLMALAKKNLGKEVLSILAWRLLLCQMRVGTHALSSNRIAKATFSSLLLILPLRLKGYFHAIAKKLGLWSLDSKKQRIQSK